MRIRCEGVGENVVFCGDYKGSMQRFGRKKMIETVTRMVRNAGKKFAIDDVKMCRAVSL